MKYKLSVEAAADMEVIWLYTLENWSVAQADRYVNLVFDECEYIASNPTTGKDFSHVRKAYRYSKVKSHLIFYRLNETQTEVEIIRILHQRMDIENRLNN